MSPKPFGKPLERQFGKGRISWPAIAFLAMAPVAFAFCLAPSRAYPPLGATGMFWTSAAVIAVWAAIEAFRFLHARTMPSPPDRLGTWKVKLGHALLAILISAPVALGLAFAYEPALVTANGALGLGTEKIQFAMVEKSPKGAVLRSPFWSASFELPLRNPADAERPVGSLAKLRVGSGALGVAWVAGIEFEELR